MTYLSEHPSAEAILAILTTLRGMRSEGMKVPIGLTLDDAITLAELAHKYAAADVTASAATLDRVQSVWEVRRAIKELEELHRRVLIDAGSYYATGREWERQLETMLTALRRELGELGEEESR